MEESTPKQPEMNEELQSKAEETVERTVEEEAEQKSVTAEAAVAEERKSEMVEETEPGEATPDYSTMDREGLIEALEGLMGEEMQAIKGRAAAIRNRFNELNREAQKTVYEAFLADGGNKDEYEAKNDGVAERFYALYDKYRERRQQFLAEQE